LQPGFQLGVDALEFMRFPRAYFATIAAEIPSIDAVAPEDAMAVTSTHAAGGGHSSSASVPGSSNISGAVGTDFMAAVLVQTNANRRDCIRVTTQLMWLLWRDSLLLYATIAQNAPFPGAVVRGGGGGASATAVQASPLGSPKGGGFTLVGSRTPGSGLASPTLSSHAHAEDFRINLSRGSLDRRTLDVHAATLMYRVLETTAAAHVFPLG
jgi:hypothetical protein